MFAGFSALRTLGVACLEELLGRYKEGTEGCPDVTDGGK